MTSPYHKDDVKPVTEIVVVTGLWANSLMPEGLIEQWLCADGSFVEAGDPIATVRIEGALHELLAPTRGRLMIVLRANSVIEPGMSIGNIVRHLPGA